MRGSCILGQNCSVDTDKRTRFIGGLLLLALPVLTLLAAAWAETGFIDPLSALSHEGVDGFVVKLRLYRALCAAGVGGSLALGGAMAQGLFRNPLADPGLLGVSGGAGFGAMIAIALLGGHGILFSTVGAKTGVFMFMNALGLFAIPALAMIGAISAAFIVYHWSVKQGQLSISMILLAGLALNSLAGAAMAALQTLFLDDLQITRAIIAWGFGTLDDRGAYHAIVVWIGAAFSLAVIPFVGLELDMLANGESDAASLGADTRKIKILTLACIALSTATAVSVCGQIAFVGLLVPHLVRRIARPRHRSLMVLSFLTGAALLLGIVVLQNGVMPACSELLRDSGFSQLSKVARRLATLQPGVTTSLVGAPFFLLILLRQKKRW